MLIDVVVAGKSDLRHCHSLADVTGLAERLNDVSSHNHRHTMAQIDGLQVTPASHDLGQDVRQPATTLGRQSGSQAVRQSGRQTRSQAARQPATSLRRMSDRQAVRQSVRLADRQSGWQSGFQSGWQSDKQSDKLAVSQSVIQQYLTLQEPSL